MLKSLNKNDVRNTPFIATKEWDLSNVNNENLILMEHSGSTVSLEFIDYGIDLTASFNNSSCSITSETQDNDLANFRQGQKNTGLFFPENELVNLDGTYKRLVYAQIKEMFYNNHRDPTKMWGMENIDFDRSQTKKFIADKFRLFDIPVNVFGEKILENSIDIIDETTDNNYLITDDGHGNLFAGPNLFSRQQEIGNFDNVFTSGSLTDCNDYFGIISSSLFRHYRADSYSQVDDTILATNWTDLTGNADATIVTGSQPKFRTNIFGTMPAVRFVAPKFLSFASMSFANFTVGVITKNAGDFIFLNNNTGNHQCRIGRGGLDILSFIPGVAPEISSSVASASLVSARFNVIRRSGSLVTFRTNQQNMDLGVDTNSALFRLNSIGVGDGGPDAGDIGEIFIWNEYRTDAQLDSLYIDYLKPLWTGLP